MDSQSMRHRRPEAATKIIGITGEKPDVNDSGIFVWKTHCIIAVFLIVVFVVGYCRSPFTCEDIHDISYVALGGKFEENEYLSNGIKIAGLDGAECIVEDNEGNLYTGLKDGRIVKILKSRGRIGEGKHEVLTKGVFPDIEKISDDLSHGRPLGLRIRNDTMFVMDAMYGLYTIDLVSKTINSLVKPRDVNPPMKFPNDLDITADGTTAYFTDTSFHFPITRLGYTLASGCCSGRLFRYDFASKQIQTVANDLCFANGVQLTQDESAVLVPETTRMRIRYFDTSSWRVKQIIHLPMMVDNVRMTKRGTFWVAGANVPGPMAKLLFRLPTIRQAIAGLVSHGHLMAILMNYIKTEHGIAVELNENGEILKVLQDPNGKLTFALSQLTELSDERFALGSYFTSMSICETI